MKYTKKTFGVKSIDDHEPFQPLATYCYYEYATVAATDYTTGTRTAVLALVLYF